MISKQIFSLNFMFLCSFIEELCRKEESDKTGCNFNFVHECILKLSKKAEMYLCTGFSCFQVHCPPVCLFTIKLSLNIFKHLEVYMRSLYVRQHDHRTNVSSTETHKVFFFFRYITDKGKNRIFNNPIPLSIMQLTYVIQMYQRMFRIQDHTQDF